MNTTRRDITILLLGGLLGAGIGLGLTGCGSNAQATRDDQDRNGAKEEREPEAPVPENLAETPCGNPEWGELPPEHEIDGDPAPEAGDDAPSEPATPSGESGGDDGDEREE